MYENYELYIVFFLISTFIFTVMGINLKYYSYTGKEWLQIISRIGVIGIMIFLMIWAFSVENDIVQFFLNASLFVFIPWLLGESLSRVIYRLKYEQ